MITLSHYTKQVGLTGIASSQGLRATDFLRLNDPRELTFGMEAIFKLAIDLLFQRIPSDQRNSVPTENLYNDIPNYMEQIRERVQLGGGYDSVYVTSFAMGSEYQNQQGDLSLYRLYGE
jgi:hypothetical protein